MMRRQFHLIPPATQKTIFCLVDVRCVRQSEIRGSAGPSLKLGDKHLPCESLSDAVAFAFIFHHEIVMVLPFGGLGRCAVVLSQVSSC